MSRFDFTPYRRSFVGFDRLFDALEQSQNVSDNYPPFNIERLDTNQYRITIAVAGFRQDEIEIIAQQNALLVKGRKADKTEEQSAAQFIHLGIANRGFERRFDLADFVRVTAANLAHGLLTIELIREIPEALKPQHIAINVEGPTATVIDGKTDQETKKIAA